MREGRLIASTPKSRQTDMHPIESPEERAERVLSSSLRVEVIRRYSREGLSPPLLKRRMPETALACVSYHTLLLADCGLLTQVAVRQRSCTVERFYTICDDCDLATDPRIDALLCESRAGRKT